MRDWLLINAEDVPRFRELIENEVECYVGEPLDVHQFLYDLECSLIAMHGIHLGEDMETPAIRAILKTARAIKRDFEAHS